MRKLLVIGLLGFAVNMYGQEAAPEAIVFYPQVLSGGSLTFQGTVYGSNWGLDGAVLGPLKANPRSMPLVDSYGFKLLTGNLLLPSGVLAFLAGGNVFTPGRPLGPLNAGLELTGLALVAAAPFVISSAHADLRTGVDLYNAGTAPALGPHPVALPQPADQEPESIYYSAGFFGPTLLWRGRTFAADNAQVLAALAKDARAGPLVEGYRFKRGLSTGLLVASGLGISAAFGMTMYEIWSMLSNWREPRDSPLAAGLMVASMVTAGGSLVFHLAADSELYEAVEAYDGRSEDSE